MFTGIITDIGSVIEIEQRGDLRARINTGFEPHTIDLGASIACAGVCLTVVDVAQAPGSSWFDVEISAETLSRTNLGDWTKGHRINLERSLKVGDELGGHIVSGHIDGLAEITDIEDVNASTKMTLRATRELSGFIATKGSVALNGTSLTVNGVDDINFHINIIPHTKQHTTWGNAKIGDKINLEIDTLARYVARLAEITNVLDRQ